jgi:hypothetical protein
MNRGVKMFVGHIIYKVNNLDAAVKKFRRFGFKVEYGRKNKPCNALIYFSQGAYLELLENTGLPTYAKKIFSIFINKQFIQRVNTWENGPEGLQDICLEGSKKELKYVIKQLDGKGQLLRTRRIDTANRKLNYQVFFPDDFEYPFFMSHFSTNPRPIKYTHPNGSTKIDKINYPISNNKIKNFLMENVSDSRVMFQEKNLYIEFDNGMSIMGDKVITGNYSYYFL